MLASRNVPAEKKSGGGFDRLRQDFDRTFGQSGDGFARGQLGVEMRHARAAFRLRKQNRVRRAGNDGVEIGVGHAGVEAVDAHQQARALFLRLRGLEVFKRGGARVSLALGRDRILEIEDDGVGAARHRLVELGPAVGGNEEQRPHHFGRMLMKALRWHSATSVPSCLKAL